MSLNLYAYCEGDPVNLVDPTGNTPNRDKGDVSGPAGGSSQYNVTGGTEAGAAGGAKVSAKIKPTAPTVSRGTSGAKYTAPKANVDAAKTNVNSPKTATARTSDSNSASKVPNPYGKKGGPLHEGKIKEVAAE